VDKMITVVNAGQILMILLDIFLKVKKVYDTKEPQSIEEELKRLDAARLRPSQDIIDEADKSFEYEGVVK
jgi:hypothetical protein